MKDADLLEAVATITRELPGWWWTAGRCDLTCHASIGPDRVGPDAHLLADRQFDSGFDADLPNPSTVGTALLAI